LLWTCFRKHCTLCNDAMCIPFTASQEALKNHSGALSSQFHNFYIGAVCAGYSAKTLSLDTLLALMLIAIWQPQIVCGLIDLIITGLFVPMSATEADVVTATLRLILLLAASPTLSLSGYQGARSRIIVFCLELLHPLPPESFLQCISSNSQVQLAMLIVLAFQASSHDCRNEMLRCTQHTQWLSRLGALYPVGSLLSHLNCSQFCSLTGFFFVQAYDLRRQGLTWNCPVYSWPYSV